MRDLGIAGVARDVISVMPAILPKLRSSGVVTAEAIVSGLAPGRFAFTLMSGKFDLWQRRDRKEIEMPDAPAIARAKVSSEVATGLLMNGVEMLMI